MSVETINHEAQETDESHKVTIPFEDQLRAFDESHEVTIPFEDQLRAFDDAIDEYHPPTLAMLDQLGHLAEGIKPIGTEEEDTYCDPTGRPIDSTLAHRVISKADPENWILPDEDRLDALEILISEGKLPPRLFNKVRFETAELRQDGETAKEALDRYKKGLAANLALSDQLLQIKAENTEQPVERTTPEQQGVVSPANMPKKKPAKAGDTSSATTQPKEQAKTPAETTATAAASEQKTDAQSAYDGNYVTIVRKVDKNGATHMYGVDKNGAISSKAIGAERLVADYGHAGEFQNRIPLQTKGVERTTDGTPSPEQETTETAGKTEQDTKSGSETAAEHTKSSTTDSHGSEAEAALRRLEQAFNFKADDEPVEESHDDTADSGDAQIEAAMRRLEKALGLDFSDEPETPKTRENEDIVIYDEDGKAWRDDGAALTKEELDQINEHAQQIRHGLTDANRIADVVNVDVRGHAHRPDGTFMPREETAAIIRNHQEILDGLASRAIENQVHGPAPEGFAEKGGNQEMWEHMNSEERQRVVEALLQEKADREAAELAAANQRESEQKRPKGIRGRIQHMMAKAAAVAGTRVSKVVERYSNEEDGSRRRKRDGLVVGAVLVAAAVGTYIAYKNGVFTPSGNTHTTGPKGDSGMAGFAGHKPHDVAGKHGALAEAHKHLGNFNDGSSKGAKAGERAHETVKMVKGDTIWHEGEEHLIHRGNAHPSIGQITEEMHRIMRQDGITEEEARHLAVGTKLKI